MFASSTYTERRRELAARLDSGLVLLLGNADSPMNYAANIYPFRQDSSFLYYCGLDLPDLAAAIDIDTGETVIFGDELTIDHIVWMGDQPTLVDQAAEVGVAATRPRADLATVVRQAVSTGRDVHLLPPYRADNHRLLKDILSAEPVPSRALIEAVVAQRSIKSDEEIAEIEQAVDLSVDMHVAAMRMVRPGLRESDVAAEVERIAHAANSRPSFPPIATVHGEILHNLHHHNTMQSGDLFLLDTGAESPLHYAGDLSSTFPVDPVFTERQKIMYELALASHEAALATVKPGVPNTDTHYNAVRAIVDGMKELGLMKGDTDVAMAVGAHAMFMPCGVGHMMGLDVHDMEDLGEQLVGWNGAPKSTQFGLKSLRLGRELEPGFVLTIEPGIYFIPKLIDLWRAENRHRDFLVYEEIDKWRDFGGIRNEEDVLVTTDGKRVLGKPKPKTVAEIEALRAG